MCNLRECDENLERKEPPDFQELADLADMDLDLEEWPLRDCERDLETDLE